MDCKSTQSDDKVPALDSNERRKRINAEEVTDSEGVGKCERKGWNEIR